LRYSALKGEFTLKEHRIILSTVLLVLAFGTVASQSAQDSPTATDKLDRHASMLGLVRKNRQIKRKRDISNEVRKGTFLKRFDSARTGHIDNFHPTHYHWDAGELAQLADGLLLRWSTVGVP
jgi:hypothetical protein